MLFAKEDGATCLEDVERLDISGKNLLFVKDWGFLERMKNLRRLDISENVEMFMTNEMMKEEAQYESSKLG